MSMTNYVLDENGNPRAEPDLEKWGRWMQSGNTIVAKEQLGASTVSTVFLGVDYNFSRGGPPILWETMVFGGEMDQEMDRCSGSREQAEAMHLKMVQRVKAVQFLTP